MRYRPNYPKRPPCKECITRAICVSVETIICTDMQEWVKDSPYTWGRHTLWEKINKLLPSAVIILDDGEKFGISSQGKTIKPDDYY